MLRDGATGGGRGDVSCGRTKVNCVPGQAGRIRNNVLVSDVVGCRYKVGLMKARPDYQVLWQLYGLGGQDAIT